MLRFQLNKVLHAIVEQPWYLFILWKLYNIFVEVKLQIEQ